MHKLKVDKKKEFKVEIAYTVEVEFVNAPDPYLLSLSSFFNFNFFFLILPNIIFNNMPVLFL